MGRHAYMILAHHEPRLLAALVSQIDDPRNDIYLHVDAKADMRQFDGIRPRRSGFFLVPRVRVFWGDVSQIEAEYAALRCAVSRGGYSHYHLVSGVDLALHGQDYIHRICDVDLPDREFVSFIFDGQREKIRLFSERRYFCARGGRSRVSVVRKFSRLVQLTGFALQRFLRYRRRFPLDLQDGDQWFTVTDAFARYLLENERLALKMFRQVNCCDEMLVPTFAYNSRFRDRLHLVSPGVACGMREIDWSRGGPYVWRPDDADQLLRSKAFFARKFSSEDESLVALLVKKTNGENESLCHQS